MDYTVDAVDEALGLLLLVAHSPGLGLTELARRSGNTKARTYRLLFTLEKRGLVQRQGSSAQYYLGFTAIHLGSAASSQIDVVRSSADAIAELAARFNETVALRVRQGLESVCIARRDSSKSVRVTAEIGRPRPLYAGASGKLLLAFAPDGVKNAVFAAERKNFTGATPVSLTRLKAELAKVRKQGFALSAGEQTPDAAAVSVPLRGTGGEVVAALSISAPANRLPEARIKECLEYLRHHADAISRSLGYVGTD